MGTDWLKANKFAEPTALQKAKCCGVSTSPLHKAADAGDLEIVQGLLEAKADPETKNSAGKTPVQLAELKNRSNVVVMLKEYPRSPEQKKLQSREVQGRHFWIIDCML